MKLICFPHAGGYACYYNFFDKLNFSVINAIYYYEYPGRGNKIGSVEETDFSQRIHNAVDYVRKLNVKAYDYALFGHSMGAFVAYEAGKTLQNIYNLPPAIVFLSGQVPPCTFDTEQKNIMDRFGGNVDFIKQLEHALFGKVKTKRQRLSIHAGLRRSGSRPNPLSNLKKPAE